MFTGKSMSKTETPCVSMHVKERGNEERGGEREFGFMTSVLFAKTIYEKGRGFPKEILLDMHKSKSLWMARELLSIYLRIR